MPISIDQVLSCRSLPSLPGVAVEVLGLTRDPNVPLDKIAKVIQNDAALTAKVLKTVNSSYYGLAQKCATLNRAIGYLGVKTVKSLVLGFSLVDTTKALEEGGFDLSEYWQRGIYSATAARLLASTTGATDPDEAFTACLFQDIGMLATYAAMGADYDSLLSDAPMMHDSLAGFERERLGFSHAEVGAKLAEKWNLPPQHVEVIRCHHDTGQTPEAFRDLARIVALGNLAAEVSRAEVAGQAVAQLMVRTSEWFGGAGADLKSLLERVADSASQLSKEFGKAPGARYDVASIMAEANDLLLENNLQVQQEAVSLQRSADDLAKAALVDGLTGAFNRKYYDAELPKRFATSCSNGTPLSVLFIDGDKFKSVNDTHGHRAGDAVLKELARRFRSASPAEAAVCRYGGEEFVILLPGLDLATAASAAESVRAAVASTPFNLEGTGAQCSELPITVSIGVASFDAGQHAATGMTAEQLTQLADHAVYAAKKNGRNRVEIAAVESVVPPADRASPTSAMTPVANHKPAPAEATRHTAASSASDPSASAAVPGDPGEATRVLLVEDDPLAGRLLMTLLGRRPNTTIKHVYSGEEALPLLNAKDLPTLVITDLRLKQMTGAQLIACARANPRTRALPMVVLSASEDPEDQAECMRAGASFFMNKSAIVTDLNRAIARLMAAAA